MAGCFGIFRKRRETITANANANDESEQGKEGTELKRIQFTWTSPHPITSEQLSKDRAGFWETCHSYGGQVQVWNALKLVCESGDLELARGILGGCGVLLPLGTLVEIYDSQGFRYGLPAYCVCDPVNVVESRGTDDEFVPVKLRMFSGEDVTLQVRSSATISDIKAALSEEHACSTAERHFILVCRGQVLSGSTCLSALPSDAVLVVMEGGSE